MDVRNCKGCGKLFLTGSLFIPVSSIFFPHYISAFLFLLKYNYPAISLINAFMYYSHFHSLYHHLNFKKSH